MREGGREEGGEGREREEWVCKIGYSASVTKHRNVHVCVHIHMYMYMYLHVPVHA